MQYFKIANCARWALSLIQASVIVLPLPAHMANFLIRIPTHSSALPARPDGLLTAQASPALSALMGASMIHRFPDALHAKRDMYSLRVWASAWYKV